MIYILEDDINIRKMLSFALKKEGFEVIGFSEPKDMFVSLETELPRLLILDIMLPGEDGFSVLKKLRIAKRTEFLPVIIMTARDSEIDKLKGLNGGADDYVTKPFGVAEMVARVQAVLRRSEGNRTQNIYQIASLTVDDNSHKVSVGETPVALSKKEYDLLLYLITADGRACTREELIDGIWGLNYGESRTLDVHIRKLRQKLLSAGDMIRTVRGTGYRIEEVSDEKETV